MTFGICALRFIVDDIPPKSRPVPCRHKIVLASGLSKLCTVLEGKQATAAWLWVKWQPTKHWIVSQRHRHARTGLFMNDLHVHFKFMWRDDSL